MLVTPAMLVLASISPAYANCTITSGTGTVALPDAGATVTCTTGVPNPYTTRIGNGVANLAATVDFEDGAILTTNTDAIKVDNPTVTLGVNAEINTTTGTEHGVFALVGGSNNTITSVTLGAGAHISTTGNNSRGVYADSYQGEASATVNLSGAAANITSTGTYADGVRVYSQKGEGKGYVTLSGAASYIYTTGTDSKGVNIESKEVLSTVVVTLSGDNSYIKTMGQGADGVMADGDYQDASLTLTLSGDNTSIYTGNSYSPAVSIMAANSGNATATIVLSGESSVMEAAGWSAETILVRGTQNATWLDLTLETNTSLLNDWDNAVNVYGGGAITTPSTIDSSGYIQSNNDKSIQLASGADSLILRTGSNLLSPDGADMGGGSDTLTLYGNATEEERFLNIETVEVNADSTGWVLTSTSSFDDINVNTGLFKNNGTLTTAVQVDAGATFGGTGTTIGLVTNDGYVEPGNSIGTQIITGNFTQNVGGELVIEFDSTAIDLLTVSGTATVNGTISFIETTAGTTQGTKKIFVGAGAIAGTISTVNFTPASGSSIVGATIATVGNDLEVTFNAGPCIDSTDTCSTTGEISYNLQRDEFIFCNGTNWYGFTTGTSGACTKKGEREYDTGIDNYKFCDGTDWLLGSNSGTLTGCAATAEFDYDTSADYYKFCNGTNWINMKTTLSVCL